MSARQSKIETTCTEEFKTAARIKAAENDESMAEYVRRLIEEDIGNGEPDA